MPRKKLGEILLERGIIDQDQLNSALAYQRQWGHRLGTALVAKGFITEGMLAKVLGEVMSLPVVDLSKVDIDSEALRLVPMHTCENNDLIPIRLERRGPTRVLTIAMADPMNVAIIDEIEFTTGCKVRPVLATISAIQSAIRKYYRHQNTNIKPLSLYKTEHRDTGKMVLVRPGGAMEQVDTSTYHEEQSGPHEAATSTSEIEQRVAQIKAKRAAYASRTGQGQQAIDPMEEYLSEVQTAEWESLQKLEKYFWALMRIMARKGLITKEEFLRELKE
ncbi:MAG: hypothetical protein D6806_05145 [Deltaproteobacteria bacterium]|nr:MAG: hypothetical protein D6806_05145 [Deltaproteobacteria bacterium]